MSKDVFNFKMAASKSANLRVNRVGVFEGIMFVRIEELRNIGRYKLLHKTEA